MYGEVTRNYKWLGWDGKGTKSFSDYFDKLSTERGDFSYCWQAGSDVVYVVEDIISADCINNATGSHVYSLLGSHVSNYVVETLRSRGYKKIVIALDADAWHKAAKYANKFNLLGVSYLTWESKLDPKDMSMEELKEVFKNE